MAKRLVIKTGEYTNGQGETKGEYTRVGVMMDGDNGPYLLLDPCVNLAGCLTKQNMMNHKNGKQVRDSLLVSVFEDDNQQQRPQQGQQQQQAGQQRQSPPQNQPQGAHQQSQGGFDNSFDDEIVF